MSTAAGRLAAGLAAGRSPLEVVFHGLPGPARATLRRCAVVPTFDRALYDQLLAPPDGVPLEQLLGTGSVAPRPGDSFAVAGPMREAAFADWWTTADAASTEVPDDLRAFAGRLAEHFAAAGDHVDRLRQLILVDHGQAREVLETAFQAAEDELTVARCYDLVSVFAEPDRAGLLSPDLAAAADEHRQRARSVTMWTPDIHQTARYLPRDQPERLLRQLLEPDGTRVAELSAGGGMGKTMLLRWFISRYCLASSRRIPCARLDFDTIDPVAAVGRPWLLLVRIAEQLDQQLPGSPFSAFLADNAPHLNALDRRGTSHPAAHRTDDEPGPIVHRFLTVLRESRKGAPVVIVLDTFEELLLRATTALDGLVDLLDALRRAPEVRIILSSRNPLSERLPDLHDRLGGVVKMHIAAFTPHEMYRYLTEVRRLPEGPLVDAIVRRCDGVPFTLALYADLARSGAALTAEDVLNTTEPALLYCIRRIVERIDDDRVRWLLRYGVVPRRLTADFVAEVVAPMLELTMPDPRNSLDDPAPALEHISRLPIFQSAPAPDPAEQPALWADLTRYAATTSWVNEVPDEPGTLWFHPNVRGPLRNLLRTQEVYRELHDAAACYFQQKATEDPERWCHWLREAIYHVAHLHPDAALDMWRSSVARAWALDRPAWAADLARDRIRPDHADDRGEPDPTVITAQARYEAHVELARVAAHQAESNPGHWPDVEQHLRDADRVLHATDSLDLSSRHAVVTARLGIAHGRTEPARRLLDEIAADLDPAVRDDYEIARLMVDVEAGDDRRHEAEFRFTVAEPHLPAPVVRRMAIVLGRAYRRDRPERALGWFRRALDDVEGRIGAAEALLDLARPAEALQTLGGEPQVAPLVAAKAYLALHRPGDAIRTLEGQGLPAQRREPQTRILLAEALGALRRSERAAAELEATARADLAPVDRARVATGLAQLWLRVDGDIRRAQLSLEAFTAEDSLSLELTRAEVAARGSEQDVEAILDGLVGRLPALGGEERISVAIAMLADAPASDRFRSIAAVVLAGELPRLESVSRRLAVLADLARCPTPQKVDAGLNWLLRDLLRDLLRAWTPTGAPDLQPDDLAHQRLLAVEVARMAFDRDTASRLLTAAGPTLTRQDPTAWFAVLQAAERIGPASSVDPPLPAELHLRDEPRLAAEYLVLLAQRQAGIDEPDVTLDRLRRAEALLADLRPAPAATIARMHDVWATTLRQRDEIDAARQHAAEAYGHWTVLGDGRASWHSRRAAGVTLTDELPSKHFDLRLSSSHNGSRLELQGGAQHWQTSLRSFNYDGSQEWASSMATGIFDHVYRDAFDLVEEDVVDVRLEATNVALAALPWEQLWALPGRRNRSVRERHLYRGYGSEHDANVSAVQAMLSRAGLLHGSIDGLMGTLTVEALRQFQHRAHLPSDGTIDEPTVRALRTSLLALMSPTVAILGASSRVPHLSLAYERCGFLVRTFPDPAPFRDTLDPYIDVIHIEGSMRTGLTPLMSCGSDRSSFSASAVDSLIRSTGRPDPPLLIVDVLNPATESERSLQLLARNIFAHRIMQHGSAWTIIGTGLSNPFREKNLLATLADSLSKGGNPAEAVTRLRRRRSTQDWAGWASVALFSAPAPFAMLPIGLRL